MPIETEVKYSCHFCRIPTSPEEGEDGMEIVEFLKPKTMRESKTIVLCDKHSRSLYVAFRRWEKETVKEIMMEDRTKQLDAVSKVVESGQVEINATT